MEQIKDFSSFLNERVIQVPDKQGKIIVLHGPPGAGKGTLVKPSRPTATRAICQTPWSTIWRVWAGATATTKSSAVHNFWNGSTWTTWAAAPRSLTKPNSNGSTPSTSRPCLTRSWLSMFSLSWPNWAWWPMSAWPTSAACSKTAATHWWFWRNGFRLFIWTWCPMQTRKPNT